MTLTMTTPAGAVFLIAHELSQASERAALQQSDELKKLVEALGRSQRTFVHGAGRTGLALQMTAMRLMHLGMQVHVVGEATTPSITAQDLLLTASGSGATPSVCRVAERAKEAGASVAVITTAIDSPLAVLADVCITVPAAHKNDRTGFASAQYAGSLFEQSVVILGDALFHTIWHNSAVPAEELWSRHANLE